MSSSETEPLLPTSRQDVNNMQPSKATAQKITAAIAALKEGKMPSNSQIHAAILHVINSDVLSSSSIGKTNRFSAEGALVVDDLKAVLQDIVKLGSEKNADNKFQRFIYHTREAADLDVDLPQTGIPVSSREAKKDANAALNSVRTLGNLVITSPEFRKILSEITFISRDLFADAASRLADKAKDAAEAARPSEAERREGVDLDKVKRKAAQVQKKARTGRYEADAQDALASAREWLDEQQPENPKDEVIERLKRVVVSVQKNKDYHESINTLVDLLKKYINRGTEAAEQAKDETNIKADDDVQQAVQLLRQLLEALANGKSLDDIFAAFHRVVQDVKGDDRLSAYFNDLLEYVNRLLHAEGYVFSQQASRKADELIDRAQQLLESNANWKNDYRALIDEFRSFEQAIEDDKTISQLTRHLAYLKEDLADFGIEGFSIFSAKAIGLYKDLYDVVLPRLIQSIKQIPLPRIEYVSEELDLAIDEFVIESVSFIPDRVELTNFNQLLFEQGYAAFSSNFDSSSRLRVKGLRFSASNIAYYINSKKGYGWEDSGLLDISLEDGGIDFDVKLELAGEDDKETFFKVKHVDVVIHNLQYSVSKSDHWILNNLLKPFARPYIHDALKRTLESQIKSFLEDADKQLFALQERARAATAASPSLAGYFRALFSPVSPFSFSSKPKVRPSTKGVVITGPHGDFRLAIGADEQLLPGRGGPSADYEQRKALILQAKSQASRALGSGRSLAGQISGGAEGAIREIGKVHADFKKQKRQEADQDGWRSKAFDV